MGPAYRTAATPERDGGEALWSTQTECGRRNPPRRAGAGRGPRLLPDHSESHRRTMLLHLIEHYNMADRLGLTCEELPACHNCSVELSCKPPAPPQPPLLLSHWQIFI